MNSKAPPGSPPSATSFSANVKAGTPKRIGAPMANDADPIVRRHSLREDDVAVRGDTSLEPILSPSGPATGLKAIHVGSRNANTSFLKEAIIPLLGLGPKLPSRSPATALIICCRWLTCIFFEIGGLILAQNPNKTIFCCWS